MWARRAAMRVSVRRNRCCSVLRKDKGLAGAWAWACDEGRREPDQWRADTVVDTAQGSRVDPLVVQACHSAERRNATVKERQSAGA